MTKISFDELKKLFLMPLWGKGRTTSLGNIKISKHQGSKKGYMSVQNHYVPPKSNMTPKKWEDQQKSFKMMAEAKKKKKPFLYQCSDCFKPMGKLGYCDAHGKWASLILVKEN